MKNLTSARKIERATPLYKSLHVKIITSGTAASDAAAGDILAALAPFCEAVVKSSADLSAAKGPVILLGNLADNPCVKYLYYKHLLFTDRTYPGKGGYELRTLLDPFATGFNILHIGFSHDDDAALAAAQFIKNISSDNIGYLCQINAKKYPFKNELINNFKAAKCDSENPAAYYVAPIEQKGALAYFTGDKDAQKEYNRAFADIVLKQDNNNDLHLRLKSRASVWRLLEISGMLDDALYLSSSNLFLSWLRSREGVEMIKFKNYQTPGYPRQNHGLLPALGITYLCDFFDKYYPELGCEMAEYKALADNVFSVYQNGNWKPICDGLCHGFAMSQPALIEYSLFNIGAGYFESGGAKAAAECAIAVTNNTGWMPESGDSSLFWASNAGLLAAAAEYYRDGRYVFAKSLSPAWRQGNIDWSVYLPRSFDAATEPQLPADHIGLKIIPMDKLVYGAAEALPEYATLTGVGAFTRPPEVPQKNCFDKIAWRSGFEKDDEYLLIDGLGGGSHSYDDAASIINYQKYGIDFLIAADGLLASSAENHNMLTIYKNGECEKIPSFAAAEKSKKNENGDIYLSLLLKNTAGSDWRRELYIIPGTAIIVKDTVIIKETARYLITSRFRTPGRAALESNVLLSKRENKYFKIIPQTSHPCTFSIKEKIIADPKVKTDAQRARFFKARYNLPEDEFCLTSYEQEIFAPLASGEEVSFINILSAGEDLQSFSIYNENGKISLKTGDKKFPTTLSAITACENGAAALPGGKQKPDEKTVSLPFCGNFIVAEGSSLSMVSPEGEKIWQTEITRIPTIYPWWELENPGAVALCAATYKGKKVIAAGCGDDSIKYFDESGKLLNSIYFEIGVPDLLSEITLAPGDTRLIAGSKRLTCRSNLQIIDNNGDITHDFGSEQWISNVESLQCIEIDGKSAVIMGVNHRNNLKAYIITNKGSENIFSKSVVGAVTCTAYKDNLIFAGTSEGLLLAYRLSGEQVFLNKLPSPPVSLEVHGNKLTVKTENSEIHNFKYI